MQTGEEDELALLLAPASEIAVGQAGSFLVRNDGSLWAWGNNWNGQFGDGTKNSTSTPSRVAGPSDITAIAAGMWHSLAIKKDGTVWGWGRNYYGALGDGTETGRPTPVRARIPD